VGLFSLKDGERDIRTLISSFENSFGKCRQEWDRLYTVWVRVWTHARVRSSARMLMQEHVHMYVYIYILQLFTNVRHNGNKL